MKKVFAFVLSLTMLFSMIVPLDFSASAEEQFFTPQQAVDIYMNNYRTWAVDTENEYLPMGYRIGFLDLNFDGTLELITSKLVGSGRYSHNEFYTIDAKTSKVVHLTQKSYLPDYEEYDLFTYGDIKLYYYKDSGKLNYYCHDFLRTHSSYGIRMWGTMVMENDAVVSNPAFKENIESRTTYYVANPSDNKFYSKTQKEYEALQTAYFENAVDMSLKYSYVVSFDWDEATTTKRKSMLLDSYNAFSYDKPVNIVVYSSERSMSVKAGEEMCLAFGLYDTFTKKLDEQWKKMALVISDPNVISVSDYTKTDLGYTVNVKGLRPGKTNLVVTDTSTGSNLVIEINVYDKYSKTYSYSITDMPSFYPNNKYENHLLTNIYNLNGIYVNNYINEKSDKGYTVSFDAYNTNYYYGAVDIYDKDGLWIGYEEIDKFSDIKSIYDTGEQALFMVTELASLALVGIDSNFLTYQQHSYSKKTELKFEVPEGGYFTISNNISQSMGTLFSNGLEIIYDAAMSMFDFATANSVKVSAFSDFKKSVSKSFADRLIDARNESMKRELKKKFDDTLKEVIESNLKKNVKSGVISSAKDRINSARIISESVANATDLTLKSVDIDWENALKSAVGIGESFFEAFTGPAGMALKGCFAINKNSNKLYMGLGMLQSFDNVHATVYTDFDNNASSEEGVMVETYGNTDARSVLQVFKVSDDDTLEVVLDSNDPLQKYELYNISFVLDDKTVQPNGTVKVQIPIPEGMKGNTCNIYRKEADSSWSILDARVEGNYLVFYTEHFSNYAVVGDVQNLVISALPTKLNYVQGETINTSGLKVKYNNQLVTSGYQCDPMVVSSVGTEKIVVRYGLSTATFDVNVKAKTCSHTDLVKREAVASTCQTNGDYAYTICKQCATVIEGQVGKMPLSNHRWNSGVVVVKATCQVEGQKQYTCLDCKNTKIVKVAKTDHSYKTYLTKATTTKNGSKITKCSVCGTQSAKSTIYYPKTITLSTTKYVYNGTVKKPAVTVKGADGKTISASNYTVTYPSGRKNVGKYTYKITFKGNYSGSVSKAFTIVPKSTTISSLSASSKGFTVKYKKQATQTTGYQIQYSTSSKFTSPKTVTVTKNSTVSKKITKLKGKKKYYVRVRTYKKTSSGNLYSAWSGAKAITTKK